MKRFLSMLICLSMVFTLFVYVPVSASVEVTYTGPQSIYYLNFEDAALGTADITSFSGVTCPDDSANITAEIKTDSGDTNKYLTIATPNNANGRVFYTGTPTVSGVDKYVVEYRIRPNLGNNGVIKPRKGGASYGVLTASFYKNAIRGWNVDDTNDVRVGTYTDGKWITVTIVYDTDFVDANGNAWTSESGDKYFERDIYIDGKLMTNESIKNLASETNLTFMDETAERRRIINQMWLYNQAGASYDLDYMRYYASNDTFAAKLASDTEVAVTGAEVYFNNIPTEAELKEKISVVDLNGNTVATVGSATINNNSDPSTEYAQSITLNFSEALEPGTGYKLKIDGLSDFSENTLSTELGFTTTTDIENKAYVNPQSIYYYDFEDDAEGKTVDSNGFYSYSGSSKVGIRTTEAANGTYTAAKDAETENMYLAIRNSYPEDNSKLSRVLTQDSCTISDADKYIIEYKIRPNLGTNGAITSFEPDRGYGVPTVSMYRGDFYSVNNFSDESNKLGDGDTNVTYEDGKWYTITAVYDGDYKTKDGSNYLVRDVYINGELAESGIESAYMANHTDFINGTGNMWTTINPYYGGAADIDYIRFYASANTFTVKVPETTDIVAGDGIEVQFNNIPLKADLLSKAVILDENGDEVCGIKGVTYNNNFNLGETYAQSITLNFEEALDKNTTYTLKLNGVSDISGNKVYHSEQFTTGSLDNYEYGSFAFAADNKTVSIDITKNVSESKKYKLIIAGYEEYNGGIKMLSAVEKEITIENGAKTYTSNEIDVTDCDYVKAFLWEDMKPVIMQDKKTITQ